MGHHLKAARWDIHHGIKDYRLILKQEHHGRVSFNRRYSLRAFARDLGLAPSRLCEIFHYKQGLSRDAAGRIADRLGYDGDRKSYFLDLVTASHARNKKDRENAQNRLKHAW